MTLRRGETLLLTVGIPVLLLVIFTEVKFTSVPGTHRINFLAPGILALCVMSTSLVALSISTAFERTYGVLRRLFTTPLGRSRLIGAKILAILVVEAIQITLVAAVAVALGWRPHGAGILYSLVALIIATVGFAGIGLALAGRLRAEVNLAAANGLYIVLLLVSGFVVAVQSFPSSIRNWVVVTPAGALADVMHRGLGAGHAPRIIDVVSLVAWAVVAPLLAARTFRFD